MKIRKYSSFLVEKLDFDDIKERLDDSYIDLKSELIEMIEETLKNIKNAEITMTDLEDFINDYISAGKDANMIDKLVEDNDIFNFYLKFQSEIDELLNDTKYMDESPSNNNVFSLYDVVIDGTKQSILDILESIKDKLFKK
jgi:ATP-dependent helicase/DNAse subunit B